MKKKKSLKQIELEAAKIKWVSSFNLHHHYETQSCKNCVSVLPKSIYEYYSGPREYSKALIRLFDRMNSED